MDSTRVPSSVPPPVKPLRNDSNAWTVQSGCVTCYDGLMIMA